MKYWWKVDKLTDRMGVLTDLIDILCTCVTVVLHVPYFRGKLNGHTRDNGWWVTDNG